MSEENENSEEEFESLFRESSYLESSSKKLDDRKTSILNSGTETKDQAETDGEEKVSTASVTEKYNTGRWRGIAAIALLTGSLGVVASNPAVLLSSVVGVGFAAYSATSKVSEPEIEVKRDISDSEPRPGNEVEIEISIRNLGDEGVADLRVIDQVPSELVVSEGSPRYSTSLKSGEVDSYSYEVVVERGKHVFDEVEIWARDMSGAKEVKALASPKNRIVCSLRLEDMPVREQTIYHAGTISSSETGEGIEFYQTREYMRGDPMSRIDWKGFAQTGDLRTVEYREENAATVIVFVDARHESRARRNQNDANSVHYSVYAAERVFKNVLDAGNEAGLVILGEDAAWIEPGRGEEHLARAVEVLSALDSKDGVIDDEIIEKPYVSPIKGRYYGYQSKLKEVDRRISKHSQLVILSPLSDEGSYDLVKSFEKRGHLTTVISPNPTHPPESVGQKLEGVRRKRRIVELREKGTHVVDWDLDESLEKVVSKEEKIRGYLK